MTIMDSPGEAMTDVRLEKIDIAGQAGWLKRVESLPLRMRLQKGNCWRAFEQERKALVRFREMGLPVPRILDQGDGFFVTEDAGPTLRRIRRDTPQVFASAVSDAARALARLHQSGVSHGRPALRDICWKDGRISFIDLERAGRARPGIAGQVNDCLLFFYDLAAETAGAVSELTAARDAYLAAGMSDVWTAASRKVGRLRPLLMALRPFLTLLRNKRDFRAVLPFWDFMTEAPRGNAQPG